MNRNTIIANCKKYLGKPYVWGGESMAEGGYDCSGYVYNVLKDSGYNAGRTTADGYRKLGRKIEPSKKQPGDLIFFGKNNKATHIAIYAGDGFMYESMGTSSNTKNNPGKGVTRTSFCRRSDILEIRTLFDVSGSVGSSKPANQTITKKSNYKIGNTYTLQAEMKVRTGPGTTYRAKKHSELTPDGRKHDTDADGALEKGTRITCKDIKEKNGEIWILAPSGWIAAVHNGKVYIR